MKILILSGGFPPTSNAGAEKTAFNLAIMFQKLGNQVYVITTVQEKTQAGKLNYHGLTVFQIYTNYHQRWQSYLSLYNPQTVSRVKEIIKQFQPDVTHIHVVHYYLSYYCLKIAKKYSQVVFLTAHDSMLFHYGKLVEFINPNDLSIPRIFNYKITPWQQIKRFKKRYNPFRNIIIRHYLKYVDKIFAVSKSLKEALEQNGIKNIDVIYNGIYLKDWERDEEQIEKFKRKYGLKDKKVIFFGGRIGYWKGGKEIMKAMERVILKIPEAVLLVAGKKNEYIIEMSKLAKEKNILVIFTGWLEKDELKSAYYASNLIITPSICLDTFNLINLEAMICKKSVVTTCFGGAPEVVIDGKTGYIVNPLNIDMMSERIIELLENSEKAREFGMTGYSRAKEFSLLKQVKKYLKYFNA